MLKFPVLDRRTKQDIIDEIAKLARSYTPEWRFDPENPDVGSVLGIIYAEMFDGTVQRFNRALYKHHIAFLNNLDLSINPAVPAGGVVTFVKSENYGGGVYVPSKTRLIAESTDGDEMIYESQQSVFVTSALISSIYSTSSEKDIIIKPYDGSGDIRECGLELFNTAVCSNLQRHFLAMCHKHVLHVKDNSEIVLTMLPANMKQNPSAIMPVLADEKAVRWCYLDGDEWKEFDHVSSSGDSIILGKADGISISPAEFEGTESCWIGCRVIDIEQAKSVEAGAFHIRTEKTDIKPQHVYADDIEQEPAGFNPFGEEVTPYSECYISCDEVFTKVGATVKISFGLSYTLVEKEIEMPKQEVDYKFIMKQRLEFINEKVDVTAEKAVWEYWNGMGWARLRMAQEAYSVFDGRRKGVVEFSFTCPEDMQTISVGAFETYWIRIRLVSVKNAYKVFCRHILPVMSKLNLSYQYEDTGLPPEKAIAFNNTGTDDVTLDLRTGTGSRLFKKLGYDKTAVYFGLDKRPEGSPVSIYFDIKNNAPGMRPPVMWEYLSDGMDGSRWKELRISDATDHFTNSGIITLLIPDDFKENMLFGEMACWIRISDIKGSYDAVVEYPVINGIYMNSAAITNIETMEEETFFIEEKKPGISLRLPRENVLSQRVFVNEQGMLSGADDAVPYETVKDTLGNITELWVEWKEVDNFLNSESGSRHYVIDRLSGTILFGDGRNGMIPPRRDDEAVRVQYQTGGGSRGNVGKGGIERVADALRFIESAYNPVPTHGGCDFEDVDTAIVRGANLLRHNKRAVTVEDFEALAFEASRSIAKVRCVPNICRDGSVKPGMISLAVLLKEYDKGGSTFLSQKERIERFITEMADCTVSVGGLSVIEPLYIRISSKIWVSVRNAEMLYEMQRTIKEQITRFLDPLTGNFSGKGWDIGELPDRERLYSYLKALNLPCSLKRLVLTAKEMNGLSQREIDLGDYEGNPFATGINGDHEVVVKYE